MLAVFGMLALVAGAARALDPGITGESIAIGMSVPLSGPNGAYGQALKEGAEAYFAQLNAAGGVNGRKIELLALDDAYDAARTVANTKKLIDESHVFALMSYYGTPATEEAMKLIAPAKIPLIGTVSGAPQLRTPVNHYLFHLRAGYADETEASVDHLVRLGVTNIAVLYQNDGFGKAGLDGITAALQKRQLKPSAVAAVERNSTEVAAAAQAIAKASPQAVLLVTLYKPSAAFVRQMRKLGQYPQFATLSPIGPELLVKELGAQEAHGIGITQVMPYPADDTLAGVKDYHKALFAFAKHRNYSYSGLEGYFNARLVAEALRRAGREPSREKLVNALETGSYDLGGYRVSFTPASHSGSKFVDLTVLGRDGRVLR